MVALIDIDTVGKNYRQGQKTLHALHDVSLTVEAGDVYGIIGLSGAGKSTLIRTLARLVPPSSGKILFHGTDIAHLQGLPLREFRKKVGMIFQHFNLLSSRTVGRNIAYPLEIEGVALDRQKERVDELLGLVGLKDKGDAYPSRLSGGEKQRVGIARALANHPELLLCDEATSALDPKTTGEILALLKYVNSRLGVTIVLITHEMEIVKQICNKVAVIDRGTIVEKGRVADVFAEPKHPITKHFLQSTTHDIPFELIRPPSPNRKLLRLSFRGQAAGEPIISQIARKFQLDANILGGWIDHLPSATLGTLIIEFEGTPDGIQKALKYLEEKDVHYEVIEHEP